jgi:hypothetical protein
MGDTMKSSKQGIFPREARTHDWALTGGTAGTFTAYKCTKCGTLASGRGKTIMTAAGSQSCDQTVAEAAHH